jgi:ABC-type antimicrobial peptide transport system permease subunit
MNIFNVFAWAFVVCSIPIILALLFGLCFMGVMACIGVIQWAKNEMQDLLRKA